MIPLALSTHWNGYKHSSGEALVEEAVQLGFSNLELGYDLRMDHIAGIKNMIKQKVVQVNSVHNFCPVPVGSPFGHPELFELASFTPLERENAIQLTLKTIKFTASVNAKVVVIHCGNIQKVRPSTRQLIKLCEADKQNTEKYEKLKTKLLMRREKTAEKHIEKLKRSLEKLLPSLEKYKICLGMENLPTWESIPTELEAENIVKFFNSPYIKHWHDIGHGRIRQNLGFINQKYWLEKFSPDIVGLHLHDVKYPACDHIMPPFGNFDFTILAPYVRNDTVLSMEPAPGTPAEAIIEGKKIIEKALEK